MRVLLVGEMPSKNGDYRKPLSGRVGRRLAKLARLTLKEYLTRFDRTNVLEIRTEPFDVPAARERARMIERRANERYDLVVVFGKNAARSFAFLSDHDYFEPFGHRGTLFVVAPHPSGLNRWWNDEKNVKRARRFLRKLAR